jgi:hypothetical protein
VGGLESGAGHRARSCEAWDRSVCVCTGMRCRSGHTGGSVASNQRVRGSVHVAARAVLIQGIDHGGQHESGGEVT